MKLPKQIILSLLMGILLLASCSKDDDKTGPVVSENATLKTFNNIPFSLDKSEGFESGLYFSTELGKSFQKKQIDNAILPNIDILFISLSSTVNLFLSPNNSDFGLPNGTTSRFINAVTTQLTIDQFNKIENAVDFNDIQITGDDGQSFADSQIPNIILFKNAAGKKGAIHVKSIYRVSNNPRIIVDIKIQK